MTIGTTVGSARRTAADPVGPAFSRSIAADPVILLYHRVAELPADPQALCVTPRHFAEHLEVLRDRRRPMSLSRLCERLGDADLDRHATAISFDDGYADNLQTAKPLLERHGVPATVFVTTRDDVDECELWWDQLERLLLEPGLLPARVCLTVGGVRHNWDLDDAAVYSERDRRRLQSWSVLDSTTPGPRQKIYRALADLLRPLTASERRDVLKVLRGLTGKPSLVRPTHRTLLPEDVVRLAADGLVDVGAHTVTHPVLAALSLEDQRFEIRRSKSRLEDLLGRPVSAFAYPYGTRTDYTAETTAIVSEAGFRHACSNFPGTLSRTTDRFQLPRVLVRDCDGDTFARHIEETCRDVRCRTS